MKKPFFPAVLALAEESLTAREQAANDGRPDAQAAYGEALALVEQLRLTCALPDLERNFTVYPHTGEGLATRPHSIPLAMIGPHIASFLGQFREQGFFSTTRRERIALETISFTLAPDNSCQNCEGVGYMDDDDETECPSCKGSGDIDIPIPPQP